ncbi:MAG: hypothetical protein HKN47_00565 [Pirellulaceae bacterium]|nr:hypothetical protein [Pirellulaceae bacterium]
MNKNDDQPEILEAQWGRDQVNAFFEDLKQGADGEHVQVRSISERGPIDRSVTLSDAHDLFANDDAKAIQIRYRFEEDGWCDTLMVFPDHVKIIRTRVNA